MRRLTDLALIWAQTSSGVIGAQGEMPWSVPEDLARFRRVTFDAAVVMGRKTWESIPRKYRPLDGRTNIVVTRDADYDADGAHVAGSLESAFDQARLMRPDAQWIWIMGGGELYRQGMQLASYLDVTEIETSVAGDTYAPTIGDDWHLLDQGEWCTSRTGVRFRSRQWELAASAKVRTFAPR